MVVRLGAVTGVGHARLINERFGRFWGWFSVGDLFILNFLTITTEFIGVSLALRYFGVSPYISVPVTGAVLVLITASGSFRKWEQAMFAFTTALGVAMALSRYHGRALGALFAIVPLDASIIGAAAVTLSTSYAFGDVFGIKHSLHRSFRDAKTFYASYTGMIILAGFIVGVLVMLSGTLVVTTLFPRFSAARTASWIAAGLGPEPWRAGCGCWRRVPGGPPGQATRARR